MDIGIDRHWHWCRWAILCMRMCWEHENLTSGMQGPHIVFFRAQILFVLLANGP